MMECLKYKNIVVTTQSYLFDQVMFNKFYASNYVCGLPRETRYSSSANETVVFPAPDKPVNQMVHPRNFAPLAPSFDALVDRLTLCSCLNTLVAFCTF